MADAVQLANPDVEKNLAIAPQSRILELDALRGFAALMVFARHAFTGSMIGHTWTGVAAIANKVAQSGVTGVDVFFVLSGYIITTLLISQRNKPDYFSSFYMKRARRILPPYLLVLLVFWLTTPHGGPFVLASLLFFANGAYLFGSFPVYGPLWSLSVEEHFYLLWPLLVKKGTRNVLIAGLILTVIGEPLARMALPNSDGGVLQLTLFRLDGLSLGALLALLLPKATLAKRIWVKRYCTAAGVAGVLLTISIGVAGSTRHDRWGGSMVFTAASLLSFACIGYMVAYQGEPVTRWLRFRPLVFMGTISYGFYLYHQHVMKGFDAVLLRFNVVWLTHESVQFSGIVLRAIACFLITVAVASISFYFFERPIQRWGSGRRIEVSQSTKA